jgi:hypothetical protein
MSPSQQKCIDKMFLRDYTVFTRSTKRRCKYMSEKEKQIVEKLKEVLPNMSDFDKGYLLGKAETMADAADNKPKNDE